MLASNLLAARSQMAFTLGFHILLVPFGLCLPLFLDGIARDLSGRGLLGGKFQLRLIFQPLLQSCSGFVSESATGSRGGARS